MTSSFHLLAGASPARDLPRLDAAWAQSASFVYLDEKAGRNADWVQQAVSCIPVSFQRDHFALLTSGSTGKPKLVIGRKDRADALARALHSLQDMEACRATVLALPLPYCYAFVNQWRWARLHGREIVPTAGLADPVSLRAALLGTTDAMICLVGAQVSLLDGLADGSSFPGILRVHFAGGRFPQEKLPVVRAIFPSARIYNNYGCAEAMPRLTLRPAEAAQEAANIGHPLPGVRLRAEEEGRLEFQSPYGAVGFVTEAGFQPVGPDDWIPTGDLAEPLPDGAWRLLGRAGEVFKRFGEKISLPEILTAAQARTPGAVAAYRDRDPAGEEGYVLVLAPPPDPAGLRAILSLFRDRFPRTHWPLRIESHDRLPLLPNGKPDIQALKSGPGPALWKQHL